jgi:hypothetical protein
MHEELDYVLHVEVVDVRHAQLKSVVMEKVGCEWRKLGVNGQWISSCRSYLYRNL